MQHAHKHHGADEVVTGSIPHASADKNVTGRNGRIKSQGCGWFQLANVRVAVSHAVAALLLSQSQQWISTRRTPRRQIGGGHRDNHQRRQGDANTGWILWTQPEQH